MKSKNYDILQQQPADPDALLNSVIEAHSSPTLSSNEIRAMVTKNAHLGPMSMQQHLFHVEKQIERDGSVVLDSGSSSIVAKYLSIVSLSVV